ncbi:MAG TPA: tetratricopeptide repeat protein, partial [bacterium]
MTPSRRGRGGGRRSALWRLAAGAVLLVLLSAAVFHAAAGFGFVAFDDEEYVVRNPRVLAGLTADGAAWAMRTATLGSWYPLTWLSLMLDVQLFGPDPRWLHRTGLALHTLAGVLLFLLLRSLTGAGGRSLLVAALFIVHPLHVESAVWISERKDVLSTCLWLAGALCHVRYARRPSPARLVPVAVFFALALAAKPMAVTFPLTLLLIDFWPLGRLRGEGLRRALLEKAHLFAGAAVAAAFTFRSQGLAGAINAVTPIPLAARLANAATSLAWYCARTVWPSDLAFFYPHPGSGAPLVPAAIAAAAAAAATALFLRNWRRSPAHLTGWLWFLATLAPVIGVVQVGAQARADRYTYVPLIGLFVMAAWLAPSRWRGRRGAAVAAGAAASAWVALLGVAAHAQAAQWRDTRTLAEHASRVAPSWMAIEHLAVAAVLDGRLDEGLSLIRRAFELSPSNPQVHYNLGWVHERRGEIPEALSWYRRAASEMPGDPLPIASVGVALAALSRCEEAVPWLERAAALDPADAHARRGLARCLATLGRGAEAAGHY